MNINSKNICLRDCLKVESEEAFVTVRERAFHSLGAEQEKESSYSYVRYFGTYNVPFTDDRRLRLCTSDTGFSNFEMYSGDRLLTALYVKTALLYFSLSGTDSQRSSLNIWFDEVS